MREVVKRGELVLLKFLNTQKILKSLVTNYLTLKLIQIQLYRAEEIHSKVPRLYKGASEVSASLCHQGTASHLQAHLPLMLHHNGHHVFKHHCFTVSMMVNFLSLAHWRVPAGRRVLLHSGSVW